MKLKLPSTKRLQLTLVICLSALFGNAAFGNNFSDNDFNDPIPLNTVAHYRSGQAAYTNGGIHEAWFSFEAIAGTIKIQVKCGGVFGTLTSPEVRLFDQHHQEVSTGHIASPEGHVTLWSRQLPAGQTYLISVGSGHGGSHGSFTLEVDNYEFNDTRQKARVLTNTVNYCSSSTEFTNDNAPEVWFKFQLPENGLEARLFWPAHGLRNGGLVLEDEQGTPLAGATYSANEETVLNYTGAQAGQWYYLIVQSTGLHGEFGLCINNFAHFDSFHGAMEITDQNHCLTSANRGATPDGTAPWGPHHNVWFKFRATKNAVNLSLQSQVMKNVVLALYDAGQNLLDYRITFRIDRDLQVNSSGLTAGAWYYVAVDNEFEGQYYGEFNLCVNGYDLYDHFEEAYAIPDVAVYCSEKEGFTNVGATNNDPSDLPSNVWFKFQAKTSAVTIDLLSRYGPTGVNESIDGTLRSGELALHNAAGTRLKHVLSLNGDASMNYAGLTLGDWYYFQVGKGTGTFKICVDHYDAYDLKESAYQVSMDNYCSAPDKFTNVGARKDGQYHPDNWPSHYDHNVWFKFQAIYPAVDIDLLLPPSGGISGYYMALTNDENEDLASTGQNVNKLRFTSLRKGSWYYLQIGTKNNRSGDFGLCFNGFESNDLRENALVLPDVENYCSAPAEFTNADANPDHPNSSTNWPWYKGYNVWFKFRAVKSGVRITASAGGSNGTMSSLSMIGLTQSDGTSLAYVTQEDPGIYQEGLSFNNLQTGEWYYVSIGSREGSPQDRGTFSLCVESFNTNDFMRNAFEVPSDNYCSAEGTLTNVGATRDGPAPQEWDKSPESNVWYKFLATESAVTIDLKTGHTQGTLQFIRAALFDGQGNELVSKDCHGYEAYHDMQLSYKNLKVGEWYFLSVDNEWHFGDYPGTFTLCMNSYPFNATFETAFALEIGSSYCSAPNELTNEGAKPDGERPQNWIMAPQNNVWFSFEATANAVNITASHNLLALYDANRNEILGKTGNQLIHSNLTVGDTYYLGVDNYRHSGTHKIPDPGPFNVCFDSFSSNDYFRYAEELPPHMSQCVTITENSLPRLSPDGPKPRYWAENTPNIWYKIQAQTPVVELTAQEEISPGYFKKLPLSLHDELQAEVKSAPASEAPLRWMGLKPGSWYYINLGVKGNSEMQLCAHWLPLNDTPAEAIDISEYINMGASFLKHQRIYTTRQATPDFSRATAWAEGPQQNVWFKFQAIKSKSEIRIRPANDHPGIKYPKIAVYDDSFTEIDSRDHEHIYFNSLECENLVEDRYYYINVDHQPGAENGGHFILDLSNCETSPSFSGGTIAYSGGAICAGNDPGVIHSSVDASGGTGAKSYQWYYSTQGPEEAFYAILNAKEASYDPPPLTRTTWYKRLYTASQECAPNHRFSNVVEVRVKGAGGVFNNQSYCSPSEITAFSLQEIAVGDIDRYEWEKSETSASSGFRPIPGSNVMALTPSPVGGSLTKVWYRRKIYLAECGQAYSNVVYLEKRAAEINPGSIEGAPFVLSGNTIYIQNEEPAAVNDGQVGTAVSYSWEKSTTSASEGFSAVNGQNAAGYVEVTATGASATYWFRRVAENDGCKAATNALQISVGDRQPQRIFRARRNGNWNDSNTWSFREAGPSANAIPGGEDIVVIKGYTVEVDNEQSCHRLHIIVSNSATQLRVRSTGDLTVNGPVDLKKSPGYGGNSATNLRVDRHGKIVWEQ